MPPPTRDVQGEVARLLGDPTSYGAGVERVERIDTHAASVFLAGERAYKIKRAVRYSFLDFSTLERRRAACEEELRLNRRTAPPAPTSRRSFSVSMSTTVRLRVVTLTFPIWPGIFIPLTTRPGHFRAPIEPGARNISWVPWVAGNPAKL